VFEFSDIVPINTVKPFKARSRATSLTNNININVPSMAGHTVGPGSAVYSGTKFAVRAISEGLRKEVKPHGLHTTILSHGAVDTELPSSVGAEEVSDRVASFYKQNAISADSFARCVIFAMSQADDVDINEILYCPTRQE
jgi:NADP-dependent 3-hydroxy acid dehydrogenase YdfG